MHNGYIIKDDMRFRPYLYGGYQCLIPWGESSISVRFGSRGLFVSESQPYEVRYPHCDPISQSADQIYSYIKYV